MCAPSNYIPSNICNISVFKKQTKEFGAFTTFLNDLTYQILQRQHNVNVMKPYHHNQVSNWRSKVSLSSKEKDRIV